MIVSALHVASAQDAPLNTDQILDMIPSSPPLSVTVAERIETLRCWAKIDASRRSDPWDSLKKRICVEAVML